MGALPPIVSFVARSGTGKTTFLCELLPALTERGVRVLVVKHDVHGFEIDKPGKDTYRLKHAGARQVLIANADQMALISDVDGDQPLMSLVRRHSSGVDLVVTEGYRKSGMPKILIGRAAAPTPFDPGPEELADAIAAVVDFEPEGLDPALPRLPLDDPGPCADLIVSRFIPTGGPRRDVTAVLLAGGRSTRMGIDKAWLELNDKPLLPQLVESLASVCTGGVTVVRRSPGQRLPRLPTGTRVVEDLLPEHAALGGLYTGLALANSPFVFLAACDMPLLDAEFVRWLSELRPAAADVVLPMQDGHSQPMHTIYGHRCLGAIKEGLLSGEFGMGRWLGSVRVERVAEEKWRAVHPSGNSFFNANTPEDLAHAAELAGRSSGS